MTERRVDLDTTGATGDNITIAEVESRADRKARRAQVYDRGVLGDRLHVDLPPELHGEWVPDNVVDIHRKQALGFRLDTEYANKRALHDKGDGVSKVGDCVFMVCDRIDKEILDEIRRDRYLAAHAPKGGKQMEERGFAANAAADTIDNSVTSKVHAAKGTDITNAIKASNT